MSCITNSPNPLGESCRSPSKDNPAVPLPPEILDNICGDLFLYRSDLKSLRLTSRAWRSSSEKILFTVTYLRFDRSSFERLRNIAEHPTLKTFVRYIHYDSRQLEIDCGAMSIDMCATHYWTNYWLEANEQRLVEGTMSPLQSDEAETQFKAFRLEFLAYASSQRTLSHAWTEMYLLHDCVSKLPNLHGIWHLPRFRGPDPISGSILGSLMRQRSSEAHKHFWNLLGAVCASGAAPRLRELKGSRFILSQWIDAAAPYVKFFGDFAALRILHLGFHQSYPGLSNTSTLANLLNHMPSLQSLELFFGAPTASPKYLNFNISLDKIISENSLWKHLASLSLHAFATSESSLRKLLLDHSTTLSSLELANVVFRHPSGDKGPKGGSWIEFFHFLNKFLRLKQVKFCQILTNCVDETWFCPYPRPRPGRTSQVDSINDEPDPYGCLKLRIERFITHDEPSPFEPLSEGDDSQPYFGLPWMFKTDSSWQFRADSHTRDHGSDSSDD
jgi:hypothetical protein